MSVQKQNTKSMTVVGLQNLKNENMTQNTVVAVATDPDHLDDVYMCLTLIGFGNNIGIRTRGLNWDPGKGEKISV